MPDRPTVLYVDCSYGFGGAIKSLGLTLRHAAVNEHVLTSQPAALVRAHLPHVRVGSMRRFINYHSAERLRAKVATLGLPGGRWLINRLLAVADRTAALVNAVRLIWIIRVRAVDIVHLNNGFLPLEAFLAAHATGVPVVVHLRDFPQSQLRLGRAAAGSIAAVIAVSDAVAEALRARLRSQLPIVTIHDPVDSERIAAAGGAREAVRARLGLAPEHVAIGIFGRVIPWKGQLEFVTAAAIAMKADARIHAVVVGDGADGVDDYYNRVKKLAADSGCAARFSFPGYQADVEAYYAAMDIVVHASITPEPFGMVVPEAMAAGKPVIAAAAGGPLEVITPEVDGLLTPPRDVSALAAAMLRLAADPDERSRMGAAARDSVAALGLAQNAASIQAVYQLVLGRGPGVPRALDARGGTSSPQMSKSESV